MNSELSSVSKGSKGLGIFVSILMVLLGVGVFMAPQFFLSIMVWIFVVGLIIYGVFMIFDYATSPIKNGWNLTAGIMTVILGFLLIFVPAFSSAQTFAFILAFIVLFTGINQITASSAARKQGSSSGWLTAAGVINIILGFFFFSIPTSCYLPFQSLPEFI